MPPKKRRPRPNNDPVIITSLPIEEDIKSNSDKKDLKSTDNNEDRENNLYRSDGESTIC